MIPEWNDHILNIPKAIARTCSYGDQTLEDELISLGNFFLVRGANAFDPAKSHNGTAGARPWLYQYVNFRIRNYLWGKRADGSSTQSNYVRWKKLLSLDYILRENGRPVDLTSVLVDGRAELEEDRKEFTRELTEILKKLRPLDRKMLEMRYLEDLKYFEIAERMKLTKQRVQQMVETALSRARRAAGGGAPRKHNTKPDWFLVEDAKKTLWGPFPGQRFALQAAVGQDTNIVPKDLEALTVLVRKEQTPRQELRQLLNVKESVLQQRIKRLLDAGLLEKRAPPPKSEGWRSKRSVFLSLTAKGRSLAGLRVCNKCFAQWLDYQTRDWNERQAA